MKLKKYSLLLAFLLSISCKWEAEKKYLTKASDLSCSKSRTFFLNDWAAADGDNRNVKKAFDMFNLTRYATPLYNKQVKDAPKGSISIDEAAKKIDTLLGKGEKVQVIMGSGPAPLVALLKKVKSKNRKKITVVSHSDVNEKAGNGDPKNEGFSGGTFGDVRKMVTVDKIADQNLPLAYGGKFSRSVAPDSAIASKADVSDLGMLHYICYKEEKPKSRKLLQKGAAPRSLSSGAGIDTSTQNKKCWTASLASRVDKPGKGWVLKDGYYAYSQKNDKFTKGSLLTNVSFVARRKSYVLGLFGRRQKGVAGCPQNAETDSCNDVIVSVEGPGVDFRNKKTMVSKGGFGEGGKWDNRFEKSHKNVVNSVLDLQIGKNYSIAIYGRSPGTQIKGISLSTVVGSKCAPL